MGEIYAIWCLLVISKKEMNQFNIFLMTFTDLKCLFTAMFFKANIHFNDFSRQELNLMTFQVVYEPCLLGIALKRDIPQ